MNIDTPTLRFRKATLQEVSLTAGVSTATVSRYLNEPGSVSAKTQARVQVAIDLLGYVSNGLARALALRRSMIMGVLAPDLEDAATTRLMDGFREQICASGYGLLLAGYGTSTVESARRLLAREVDGLFLIGAGIGPDTIDLVERHGKAFVTAASNLDGVPAARHDHRLALDMAAAHLLALGHRRIGIVTRTAGDAHPARLRVEGMGGMLHEETAPRDDWTQGRRAAGAILSATPQVTAIIASSDCLAAAAILECSERKIDVPGRVSVVGCGDTDLARAFRPAITSVRTSESDAGVIAADYLIDRAEGGTTVALSPADFHLSIRHSTASRENRGHKSD